MEITGRSTANGPGAAAVLAAGLGCFCMAVFAFAGDKSLPFKNAMNWWKPTGPLSGVSTLGILVWLAAWLLLDRLWARKTVQLGPIVTGATVLLVLAILLTFPPIVDWL
jgi:hypothetical protein